MFRFLHLADVHLDTTFLCRSDHLRRHLRNALRSAFERAIDTAIDEELDAVLVAGDLFDSDRLSFITEQFLVDQVRRLHEAGIRCVYVTGNHDPGGRAAEIAWPDTFHYIGAREPSSIDIRTRSGGTARVVGAGHLSARERKNLAKEFPVASDGVPHVGLLHTMVAGAGSAAEHDRYAPCTLEDLRRPGFAYWALGHIHVRQRVCDRSHAHYAGNIQGRHAGERGPKGGLLVTLREGGLPDVSFRAFAATRWETLRVENLEEVKTLDDLQRRVHGAFEEVADGADESDWILRVELSGPCRLAEELQDAEQRAELEEVLARSLDVLDVEVRALRVTPPVDLDAYRDQPHLLAEVLSLIGELERDPERLEELSPRQLAAGGDDARAYLSSLLEGLDREAAARLIRR